jgi:hypothetical protein
MAPFAGFPGRMRNLSRAERRDPSRQVQRDLKGIAKGMVARSSGSRRLPINIPFADHSDSERRTCIVCG